MYDYSKLIAKAIKVEGDYVLIRYYDILTLK